MIKMGANKAVLKIVGCFILVASLQAETISDETLKAFNEPWFLDRFTSRFDSFIRSRIVSKDIINTHKTLDGYELVAYRVKMRDGLVLPEFYLPFKDGKYAGDEQRDDGMFPTAFSYVNNKLSQSALYAAAIKYISDSKNGVIHAKIGNPNVRDKYVILADPMCGYCINFVNNIVRKGTINDYDIDLVIFPNLGEKSAALAFNLAKELKSLGDSSDRLKNIEVIKKYFNKNVSPELFKIDYGDRAAFYAYKERVQYQILEWKYLGSNHTPTFFAIDQDSFIKLIRRE